MTCYYDTVHLGNIRAVVDSDGNIGQVTHYYPFGGVFADAPTGQSLQPYKYNGKELGRMHGLDWYDYGFRSFDPILHTWDRMDPLCEKYYHLSPYCYCAGNPVNFTDPNGMDVAILLVDSNPFGHLAMLIQNKEGKWLYYSINGVESSMGASDRNDVAIEGNWNNPQEFLKMTNRKSIDNDTKSNHNLNIYNYTDAFVISTSPDQDREISRKFSEYSKTEYHVLTNNCATIVQKSLIAGGLNKVGATITHTASPQFGGYGLSHHVVITRPHEAFNAIKRAYKGLYFSK